MEYHMFPLYDEKAFGFPFKSVRDDTWFGAEIKASESTVFMDVHKAYMILKPISENKT